MTSSDYTQAFACGVEAWSEFWGDPLFSGTLMMVTYTSAALLTARRARRLRGMERAVWSVAAVLLVFQIFNTPLDLHGLLWATGRCLSHIQGWHAERYAYQRQLLIVVAIALCIIVLALLLVLRRDLTANGLLVIGLSLSLGMTITKGINYHHLEAFYQRPLGPLRIPDVIELTGIACVLLAASLKFRTSPHAS